MADSPSSGFRVVYFDYRMSSALQRASRCGITIIAVDPPCSSSCRGNSNGFAHDSSEFSDDETTTNDGRTLRDTKIDDERGSEVKVCGLL